MQYQIPQFIEIEDQVVGSLTIKQFLYLIGGAGAGYVLFRFLPLLLAIPLIIAVVSFAGMLAFYKVNNRPFADTVESATMYFLGSKLYLWKSGWNKNKPKETEKIELHNKTPKYNVPAISQSKLKELSWSLDINEKLK